ncbi:MAG TPA: hypothetical protein VEL05_07890, partial [Candidatus Acidoferrum sp.]|nr:hypothetical protein [Candidatus Acidoferrum sp.]
GAVAFPVGWVASLLLAVAAALVIVARRSKWTAWTGQAAAGAALVALVVGTGFAWTYPGFEGLGVGWALVAYLGGAVLGASSAGLLIGGGGSRPAP